MTNKSQHLRAVLLTACFLSALILLGLFLASPPKETIMYKGKSLEAWFYGDRSKFFQESTTRTARDAFNALDTNAIPYLLSNLKRNRGNGALFFKFYRAMPAWIRSKLSYPISYDDIRAITLDHLFKMRSIPGPQIQILADCVPSLDNPRLRLMALNRMRMNYQTDPAFLNLCRKLLNDEHQGIRLEAAISLAESAIASDPGETELFPILLTALESENVRKSSIDIAGYRFQQQPPGGSGRLISPSPPNLPQPWASQEDVLRTRVVAAMYRLERYLSQEQKDAFRRAIR